MQPNTTGVPQIGNVLFAHNFYQHIQVRTCVRLVMLDYENDRVEISALYHREPEYPPQAYIEIAVGVDGSGPMLVHNEFFLTKLEESGAVKMPADFNIDTMIPYIKSRIENFDNNPDHSDLLELDYDDLERDINNHIANEIPALREVTERLVDLCIKSYRAQMDQMQADGLAV